MKGLVVVTLLLLLAGCGGGGGGDGVEMPEDVFLPLAADERVLRIGRIMEKADTLLVPAIRGIYSLPEGPDEVIPFGDIDCSGVTCGDGNVTFNLTDLFLTDLINSGIDVSVSDVNLQSRLDGFDTVSVRVNLNDLDIGALLPGLIITEIPEALGYGFWGEHGMAGVSVANDPFSGRASGIPFSGDMAVAVPFVLGHIADSNPGAALWTGIAEIVYTRTFRREEGTVTLTIPELVQPTVKVGVLDDRGNPIGKPGWMDMKLLNGGFETGTAGSDYLRGNFYGVDHSEAYGVFDTDIFTGAFGAKRQTDGQ